MGKKSIIRWTATRQPDGTLKDGGSHNLWMGCHKVRLVNPATKKPFPSACDNCYIFPLLRRMGKDPEHVYRTRCANFFAPLRWEKELAETGERRRIFTCSISDFFHPSVPNWWRNAAWYVIRNTPHLDWLILTKRIQLAKRMLPCDWGSGYPNVWLGVTAEHQPAADARIPDLLTIPAMHHFISAEPLLGPLDLTPYLTGDTHLDWVIDGFESGAGYRPANHDWARAVREQCVAAGVALFEKQDAGFRSEHRLWIDGLNYEQWPGELYPPHHAQQLQLV